MLLGVHPYFLTFKNNIVVLYTVFGFVMVLVAAMRRTRSNEEFFADGHGRYFRTSGRVVLITSILAMALYINLIVLLLYK